MEKKIINIENKITIKDIKKSEKIYLGYNNNESLEFYLNELTKDELVKIGGKNNKRGLTNLKKADVVEKLNEVILDNISSILNELDMDVFNYINEVIKTKGIKEIEKSDIDFVNYFKNRGLIYLGVKEESVQAVTPVNVLEKINLELKSELEKKSKINSEVMQVAAGLCYTFGLFKIEDIAKAVNKYFDFTLKNEEIIKILHIGKELGYEYIITKDYVYHTYIQDLETTLKEIEKNKDIKEVRLDKGSLLRIGKKGYLEDNKDFKSLEKLLAYLFKLEKEVLNEELEFINVAVKNDMEIEAVCEEFLLKYEIEDELDRGFIKEEVRKAALSVGKWSLKGNTMKEIEGKNKIIVAEEKIGRNDPCICGSKKKYKKCCGK